MQPLIKSFVAKIADCRLEYQPKNQTCSFQLHGETDRFSLLEIKIEKSLPQVDDNFLQFFIQPNPFRRIQISEMHR